MSAPINDGGPAFPNEPRKILDNETVYIWKGEPGMTLRDYFAGKVLGGYMACNESMDVVCQLAKATGKSYPEILAAACYETADAMLAKKGPTQ